MSSASPGSATRRRMKPRRRDRSFSKASEIERSCSAMAQFNPGFASIPVKTHERAGYCGPRSCFLLERDFVERAELARMQALAAFGAQDLDRAHADAQVLVH